VDALTGDMKSGPDLRRTLGASPPGNQCSGGNRIFVEEKRVAFRGKKGGAKPVNQARQDTAGRRR